MSIPVIFSNITANIPVTTAAQLSATSGSIKTILDIVLVNGLNETSIVSITRVGTTATLELAATSPFIEAETIEIKDTGEANFNGIFKVISNPTPLTLNFTVQDTGSNSVTGVGTVKHASAGWEFVSSPAANVVVYRSGLMPDGTRREIQIEDNNPYASVPDFRVTISKGWVSLNTANKISTPRRFSKVASNNRWIVIADDKTIYICFGATNFYAIGYSKEFDTGDQVPFMLSSGADSPTYGTRFGGSTISTSSNVFLLDSYMNSTANSFGTTTILGSLESAATELSAKQGFHRSVNPVNGDLLLCPIDIWEKVTDLGQTHALRSRARGIYQLYGRISINYIVDSPGYYYKMKTNDLNGKPRFLAVFYSGGANQLAIDLTGEW